MQALKTIEEAMGANSAVHYCELYIEMATFSIENSTKKAGISVEIRSNMLYFLWLFEYVESVNGTIV